LSWQEVEASIALDHSTGRAVDGVIHSIKDPIDQRQFQVSGTATPIIVKSIGKKKV
jgi:hypothetical protein